MLIIRPCADPALVCIFRCVLAWYEAEGVLSYGLRGLLLAGTIMVTYGDAKQGDSSSAKYRGWRLAGPAFRVSAMLPTR